MPDIGLVKGDRSLISMSEVLQASHTNDDFLTVYKAALIKQARFGVFFSVPFLLMLIFLHNKGRPSSTS